MNSPFTDFIGTSPENFESDISLRNEEILSAEEIEREDPNANKDCEGRTCWAKIILNKLAGLNLPVNNTLDEQTKIAIADFQAKNNLPQTKTLDAVTERMLLEADAIQKKGTTAVNIITEAKTKIEDWTAKGIEGVKNKPQHILNSFRDPRKVYAFVLHHMAFKRKGRVSKQFSDPLSYLSTGAHFCIMLDGRIIQLHPVSRMIWHGNCLSPRSVAVEFEGNFPNIKGKWWKDKDSTFQNKDIPTQAQYDAGKFLTSYLKTVLGTTHILAHRQGSDSRENDPGPDIWYNVGQWAIDNLGLSDGGATFKCGTGNAILPAWRTWGNKTSTLINREFNDAEDEVTELETGWENFSEQTDLNETSDVAEWTNNEMNENETQTPALTNTKQANAYLTLTGEKQGQIKGSVTQKGREGSIAVYQVHHEITSPRDAASGMATGRRIHKPLAITKEIDVASVKLMNALVTNEKIKEVVINFYQSGNKITGGIGKEVNYYRIKLSDAIIVNISNDLSGSQLAALEKVEFVYQKIEWQYLAGTSLTALDNTGQVNEFGFTETEEEQTEDFENVYEHFDEEQENENSEFDSEYIENEFPVIYPESITGASPFALQAKKQWKRSSDEMRPPVWQGKVFGLVVHTSGGSLPGKSVAKNEYPTVGGVNYYSGSTGTHYVNGWRGIFGGDLVQVGSELKKAYGVGMRDQRISVTNGKFEKDLPAIVVSLWKKKWPAYTNPMKLLPNITDANACYIHVECLPVVYYVNKKTVIDLKHPPMRPGLRFTKEQHDTIAILAYDIAWRNGWPMDQQWWKTPRLVGHEDLAPINRHDKNGGWDPGGLRESPYFDWDYVYAQIEKIHQHGYGALINNAPLNIIPELKGIYSGYTALFVDNMTPESSGTVTPASQGTSGSSVASTGVKALSIDVKKAIRLNTYYSNSLGWNKFYDKINDFLLPFSGLQNVSLGEEAFAQAVASWQKSLGFAAKDCDGIIGPASWKRLKTLIPGLASAGTTPVVVTGVVNNFEPVPSVYSTDKVPSGFRQSSYSGWHGLDKKSAIRVDDAAKQINKSISLSSYGITEIDIDTFQRLANAETGGRLQNFYSLDMAIVSIGFRQFTFIHGNIHNWIEKAPAAFKRYGIEIDYSTPDYVIKRSKGDYKVKRIKGVTDPETLRWNGWAQRFYHAGLDYEIIIAEFQLAKEYFAKELLRLKTYLKNDTNYSNFVSYYHQSAHIRAFFHELNNAAPAYVPSITAKTLVKISTGESINSFFQKYLLTAKENWPDASQVQRIYEKTAVAATTKVFENEFIFSDVKDDDSSYENEFILNEETEEDSLSYINEFRLYEAEGNEYEPHYVV